MEEQREGQKSAGDARDRVTLNNHAEMFNLTIQNFGRRPVIATYWVLYPVMYYVDRTCSLVQYFGHSIHAPIPSLIR